MNRLTSLNTLNLALNQLSGNVPTPISNSLYACTIQLASGDYNCFVRWACCTDVWDSRVACAAELHCSETLFLQLPFANLSHNNYDHDCCNNDRRADVNAVDNAAVVARRRHHHHRHACGAAYNVVDCIFLHVC
jgi:hypothetical protein